jgi:predicted O-methyltransferase YrrM
MTEYKFTEDWTTPHVAEWEKQLGFLRGRPNIQGLEIGCFEGRSSLWFLENVITGDHCSITCVDSFEGGDDQKKYGTKLEGLSERFYRNVTQEILKGRLRCIPMKSRAAFNRLAGQRFVFIYIDGSHLAPDVLDDSINAWALLNPGGILIWDDYGWNLDPDEYNRPKKAIDAFVEVFKNHLEVLHVGWQYIVRKKN